MRYIVATHNMKKLKELSRILEPLGIEAVTDRDLGLSITEVEETGTTFEENAYLKAASACKESGLPAIADDSGLCVDALDGAPGLYSARFAGEGASDADKIKKLLDAMAEVPAKERTARFVSAICCVFPDGKTLYARGECEGVIAFAPSGDGGFGYDPVFFVGDRSFADMTAEEKDAISHRGCSLRAFSKVLKTYLEQGETTV
ncbi:MAG: RdgB/HAM1 family non-canonical purine NTP pyrophosphatase [Clostridia bacterium]|nr:RdgB/HAM1 family non-canonical purine NTP pyrophosphatase [Clostridia bacterium]